MIVCDGYEVGHKKKKSAAVTEDKAARYEEYKAQLIGRFGRVCAVCGCGCTCGVRQVDAPVLPGFDPQVVELTGWHGFGLGLKHALGLVKSELVLVLPHDMEFMQPIPVTELTTLLLEPNNGVEYLGFANSGNLNHAQRMQAKSGVRVTPVSVTAANGNTTRLLPLCQWKENPHLCSVIHYQLKVYGPEAWPKIKKGQFIEDTVGQQQRTEISAKGMEAHAEWGTFLFWPLAEDSSEQSESSFAVTYHMDGVTYRTCEVRVEAGHVVKDFERERLEAAAAVFVPATNCSSLVPAEPNGLTKRPAKTAKTLAGLLACGFYKQCNEGFVCSDEAQMPDIQHVGSYVHRQSGFCDRGLPAVSPSDACIWCMHPTCVFSTKSFSSNAQLNEHTNKVH